MPPSRETHRPTAAAATTRSPRPQIERTWWTSKWMSIVGVHVRPESVRARDATDVDVGEQHVVGGARERPHLGRTAPRRVPVVATRHRLERVDAGEAGRSEPQQVRALGPDDEAAGRVDRAPQSGRLTDLVPAGVAVPEQAVVADDQRVAEDPDRTVRGRAGTRVHESCRGGDPQVHGIPSGSGASGRRSAMLSTSDRNALRTSTQISGSDA